MYLDNRQGFNQQIITSSHEIYIQQSMISYNTVNSFIVADSVLGVKLDNNFLRGVGRDSALEFKDRERVVVGFREELVVGRERGGVLEG